MKSIVIKGSFFLLTLCLFLINLEAQDFSRQDTLRGSITPERAWWDLTYYHLDIAVNPTDSTITGKNTIQYKVLENDSILQVDLQPPLRLTKAIQNDTLLEFENEGNVYWIKLYEDQHVDQLKELIVHYEGRPQVAFRPPWDAAITWSFDSQGKPFIGSSCQIDGASAWWPCKDHMYDEPDSMRISVNVPKGLQNISNGRLESIDTLTNGTTTSTWFVSNPINNYGVSINIADYAYFSELYQGEKGPLDCEYYVLHENLEKAKSHFAEVSKTLEAFEHWFGHYPFYEDGFKLIETPYLGMEHQSAIAYGNGYQMGYRGWDRTGSGLGLEFDYIIVHEIAHEWFANNITYQDAADMWIHEGFACYAEALFLEYHLGKEAYTRYINGLKPRIRNSRPMIGPYDVNQPGGDVYNKGAVLLHMVRQLIDDDQKWRKILRGLNQDLALKTVSTDDIEKYIDQGTDKDLKIVFDQYLRSTDIPSLEYGFSEEGFVYRWNNCLPNFNMPVRVSINNGERWLTPATEWQLLDDITVLFNFDVDPNFYVTSSETQVN